MKNKTYKTLLIEKSNTGDYITYSDKLSTIEWQNKREVIINRDKNICTNCKLSPSFFSYGKPFRNKTEDEKNIQLLEFQKRKSAKIFLTLFGKYPKLHYPMVIDENPIILHVHHKYYIDNKLPWEYKNDALITLCQICHQNLHDSTEIPVYEDENMTTKLNLKKCDRCNGSGYLNEFHYHQNGICFKCDGNKYLELI